MSTKEITSRVSSIVLAGGLGTRLFPLTQTRCKPSVSFGGQYRLIDVPLSNSLNARVSRTFVIAQYFSEDLHDHIKTTYGQETLIPDTIEMLCPQKTSEGIKWFQGTADAVRQNISCINQSDADYFLILSGDQLYNMDFQDMINFAIEKKAELVVATIPVKQQEAKRMGLMKINDLEEIISFAEKPKDADILSCYELTESERVKYGLNSTCSSHYLGSMGIYVFKKETLIELLEGDGLDFGADIIPKQLKRGGTYAYIYDGYWEDIGTISSFYYANLALLDGQKKNSLDTTNSRSPIFFKQHKLPSPLIKGGHVSNSFIAQGCLIEADSIEHSIIGLRSHIKKGTIIKDSVILGHHEHSALSYCSIGENCLIQKTIIDEQCEIGNNVQLINKNNYENYDGDGIYVRDGIIIVKSQTSIPNNFIF
ncbi:MAG: sugar phosphate nucleotidyltransferase [Rhabdochlamydiaceae bacterium]